MGLMGEDIGLANPLVGSIYQSGPLFLGKGSFPSASQVLPETLCREQRGVGMDRMLAPNGRDVLLPQSRHPTHHCPTFVLQWQVHTFADLGSDECRRLPEVIWGVYLCPEHNEGLDYLHIVFLLGME